MRFSRITLCMGALLLIAAQDAPEPAVEADDTAAPADASLAAEESPEEADAAAEATDDAPEPAAEATEPMEEPAAPPSDPAEAADEPAAPPAEAAPAEAMPAKGDPPTKAFMVGVWTEDLDKCGSALDFKADGSLIGPFPRWDLTDEGVLTLAGSRQKIWLKVINKDTMQSRRSETDPPRTLKRCPAATPSE